MGIQRIIGIDPGLQCTGWGMIEMQGNHMRFVAADTVKTDPKAPLTERLLHIFFQLQQVVALYKPHTAAIEETFINSNPLSSLKLGHARGVAMVALASAQLEVAEYASTAVKKAVVGIGRADKQQVMAMMKTLLPGCNVTSADAADALAIAVCHAGHLSMNRHIKRAE
jgi:crossover junction endodeoxyribonuclease RuvC